MVTRQVPILLLVTASLTILLFIPIRWSDLGEFEGWRLDRKSNDKSGDDKTRGQVQSLKSSLSTFRSRYTRASAQVEKLSGDIARVTSERDALAAETESLRAQVTLLQQAGQGEVVEAMSPMETTEKLKEMMALKRIAADQATDLRKQLDRLAKFWGCGISDNGAEAVLLKHPAITAISHPEAGHEYFRKTVEIIKKLGRQRLQNSTFLEIGYGVALSSAIMRGLGTDIYATEIQPVPWVPLVHGPFFDQLMADVRAAATSGELGKNFDVDRVADFPSNCGRDTKGVRVLQTTLEKLEGVPDGAIDVAYSLAVLEHISDPDACMKAIARVMRKGGLACHQIDMRDHRTPSQPWNFMLDDAEFEQALNIEFRDRPEQKHPFFGNRLRLSEFMAAAKKHGLQTVLLDRQHEPASEEGLNYARVSLEKLRQCSTCKYQYWPREDFDSCTSNRMPITGVYWCTRNVGSQAAVGDEKPPCGQDVWSRHDFNAEKYMNREDAYR